MSMTPQILQEIISGGRLPYIMAMVSPDRSFALVTVANEMRMSLWVEHGSLYRVENAESLTDLGDSMWSVDSAEWQSSTSLSLSLSRYPGGPVGVKVEIDLHAMLCTFTKERKTLPLTELYAELDRLARMPNRVAI
jgi:hypothetical protein